MHFASISGVCRWMCTTEVVMRDFVTVARTGAGYLATKTHEHRDGAWHKETC